MRQYTRYTPDSHWRLGQEAVRGEHNIYTHSHASKQARTHTHTMYLCLLLAGVARYLLFSSAFILSFFSPLRIPFTALRTNYRGERMVCIATSLNCLHNNWQQHRPLSSLCSLILTLCVCVCVCVCVCMCAV